MASTHMLAGRGERAMAQALDISIAVSPLVLSVFFARRIDDGSAALLLLLSIPWLFFHTLLSDGLGGQSWGKRFFDIRVVDAKSGEPCTFMQSFIRNVVLSGLGPIDWLFVFGERRQRLGDRAAGTIVVDAA
jgi:uncharacterized RDD family membrane protein YckC